MPGRAIVVHGVEAGQRAARGALRGEDPSVDDQVQRAQQHVRSLGRQHDDPIAVGGLAREGGQVVGPVDGGAVVDVVGAGDEDRPDRRVGQALELGRGALHGSPWLGVRIEQVAGDEHEVDVLGQREVDVARKAANWRSRWAAACSPRSAWRAPRWTSAVWSRRSIPGIVTNRGVDGEERASRGPRRGRGPVAARAARAGAGPDSTRRPLPRSGAILSPTQPVRAPEVPQHVTRVARHQASFAFSRRPRSDGQTLRVER